LELGLGLELELVLGLLLKARSSNSRERCEVTHTGSCAPELCGSWNIVSASVRQFWPQIRVHNHVHRQMLSPIRCQSASRFPTNFYIQSSLHIGLHPIDSHLRQCTSGARINLPPDCTSFPFYAYNMQCVYDSTTAIASAHCTQRMSLPSAELQLMIRVNPYLLIFVRVSPRISKISCGAAGRRL